VLDKTSFGIITKLVPSANKDT